MISDPLRHENTFSVTDPNHYAQTPQTTNEIQWEATEKEMIQSRQRNIMMSYEQSQVKMLWMRGYISFRESVREFKVSRKHRSQVKMLWNENSWLYFISRASQRDQSVPQEHTLDFTKLFILRRSGKSKLIAKGTHRFVKVKQSIRLNLQRLEQRANPPGRSASPLPPGGGWGEGGGSRWSIECKALIAVQFPKNLNQVTRFSDGRESGDLIKDFRNKNSRIIKRYQIPQTSQEWWVPRSNPTLEIHSPGFSPWAPCCTERLATPDGG